MIIDLKEKLKTLGNKTDSEENLKIHITSWFLQKLGYDLDTFDYEHKLCRRGKENKHADIYIPIDRKGAMFVETKKFSKDLEIEDLLQLAHYITLHNEIAWGILTNGRQYYLLCNSINIYGNGDNSKDYLSKVVMAIEYNEKKKRFTNEIYFKYFSKEAIYDSCVTNYFKAIAQFFAKHTITSASISRYQNTLYRFFDYYISKGNNYVVYGSNEYAPLEEISSREFIFYLKDVQSTTRKASGKVPKAKCAHITAMYDVLEKNGFIRINNMKDVLARAKVEFGNDEILQEENTLEILNEERIKEILFQFRDKPHKTIIFILAAYYGFDRSSIIEFLAMPWSDIDFNKHIFWWKNKSYRMVTLLEEMLQKLLLEQRRKGIKKPKAIHVVKRNGKYVTVKSDEINFFFDEIKQMNEENSEWKLFNPQNARSSLIYNMFMAGCTLEEIAYLTDSSIAQVIKYIPDNLINKKGEKSWNRGKNPGRNNHPFKEIFDKNR